MGYYQGKALQTQRRPRRPAGRIRRVMQMLLLGAGVVAAAHLPWGELRRRAAIVTEVRVEGAHYLDAARIAEIAGIRPGEDLFGVSLERSRQVLLLDSRVAWARVSRRLPRGIRIEVEERVPVILVHHGVPWEIDSAGVLLAPLQRGVVADVPLLVGPHFEDVPAGSQVRGAGVRRGLAWVQALSDRALQLSAEVSEVDVSDADATALTLISGTRIVAPAWPPSVRRLSALRVVLADLKQKGTAAQELDLRFEHQVIVRPAVTMEDSHSG